MMTSEWLNVPSTPLNKQAATEAEARQMQLTKPPGALGQLETIAIRLAAMQGTVMPSVDDVHITLFAADHGVATRGISAFPQAVTVEMLRNFSRGGAAINVLARHLGATLNVINLGTASDPGPLEHVIDRHLGPGTADFVEQAAMSEQQFYEALNAGRQAAERAALAKGHLFIGGEMGIGNTTSAAAIACALLDKAANILSGPGTGLDQKWCFT